MSVVETVSGLLGVYAGFWTLYLLSFPLLARVRRSGRSARREIQRCECPSFAIIIPGHNVASVVEGCIAALRADHYPQEKVTIYVAADHCTDDTVERARAAGVTALVRNEGSRGKTFTLAWTFDVLKRLGVAPDMYVVVDATVRIQPGFLAAFADRFNAGAHIIGNHTVVATSSQSWYARCLALMFAHRSLQNWSRERLGISALLTGCGMAFSRRYIEQFGWTLALPKTQGSHPTEDWRHAVRAVDEGFRVAYADDALVSTPLRNSLSEATQQGARWERGRLLNAGTYAIRLLVRGLCQSRPIKIFAALDAMQPPVAILAVLTIVLAVSAYLFPSESIVLNGLRVFPLGLVGAYAALVVVRGRHEGVSLITVLWSPIYLLWRCSAFILAWAFLDRIKLPTRQRMVPDSAIGKSPLISQRDGSSSKKLNEAAGDTR